MTKAILLADTVDYNDTTCKQSFVRYLYERGIDKLNWIKSVFNFNIDESLFRDQIKSYCDYLNCPDINYTIDKNTIILNKVENSWWFDNPLNIHHLILLIRWAANKFNINLFDNKTLSDSFGCDSFSFLFHSKIFLKTFDKNFILPAILYSNLPPSYLYYFSIGAMAPSIRNVIYLQIKKQFDIK